MNCPHCKADMEVFSTNEDDVDELNLYYDIYDCPQCGKFQTDWRHPGHTTNGTRLWT